MSLEPRNVPEDVPKEGLGSLRGCLVEGDAGQRSRERASAACARDFHRCAMRGSCCAHRLPLFGKPQRIAYAYANTVPPYSPYRNATHNSGAPRPHGRKTRAVSACQLTFLLRSLRGTRHHPQIRLWLDYPKGLEMHSCCIDGVIPLSDSRQRVWTPPNTERQAPRPQSCE